MEKNTKWAIILCTIVLVVWGFTLTSKKDNKQTTKENPTNVENVAAQDQNSENTEEQNAESVSVNEENSEVAVAEEIIPDFPLTEFVFENDVSKITFTNKGGDIKGYELVQHKDKDRKQGNEILGVEMVDNKSASSDKRSFSIALNNEENYIEDSFEVFFSPKFYEMVKSENKDSLKDYVLTGDEYKDVILVKFISDKKGYTLAKTYTFQTDDYMFKLDVDFGNTKVNSYSIKSPSQIGPSFDKSDKYEYRNIIYYSDEDKDDDESFSTDRKEIEDPWKWIGVTGKYFEVLVHPENGDKNKTLSYQSTVDKDENTSYDFFLKSTDTKDTYYIYVGPRTESELSKYNNAEDNKWGLEKLRLDYSMPSSFLSWLQTLLKWILELFHLVIPNWGVAIILLTVLLKLALYPLTKKSLVGTQKMQQLQPKMEALRAKYQNNPQKLQAETAKLYQEVGYNPLSGCLPLIFQFLILWSMYQLFNNYFEFRGSSFIPGWIDDLSRGDEIYRFEGDYFLIGNAVRLLPVIYLVSQLLYGKISSAGNPASGMNMKMMMYVMPIMFFVLFYSAPAGLLLYWTVSNIFQLGQQLLVNKMMKKNTNSDSTKNFKIVKNNK